MFERKLTRKEVELIQEIETFIKDKHRKAQGHTIPTSCKSPVMRSRSRKPSPMR
jgi:hypothetical protein